MLQNKDLNFQYLDLSDNFLESDQVFDSQFEIKISLKNLTELNLANNRFSPEGIKRLGQLPFKALKNLDLSYQGNVLVLERLKAIAQSKNFKTIERLEFRLAGQVLAEEQQALEEIKISLPHLQTLLYK